LGGEVWPDECGKPRVARKKNSVVASAGVPGGVSSGAVLEKEGDDRRVGGGGSQGRITCGTRREGLIR